MAGDAKIYRSLSGSEIHAVFGNIKFGDIQMIKYAVSRQKARGQRQGGVRFLQRHG